MKKHLLFTLWVGLCCLMQVAPGYAQAQTAPTTGLLAQYLFDESRGTTGQEATGQQGSARPSGGTWRPGAGYDGRGAIELLGAARVDLPLHWQPQTFTVSFWLFPTWLSNYSQRVRAASGWGAFFFHADSEGRLYVGTDLENRIVLGNNALQTGGWRHYVFTFDKGVGTIYQNGVQLGRRTDMRLPTAWNGMVLGETGDARYDDLRVYNRALSAQEVSRLATYRPYLPQDQPSADTDHNWTLERSFDGQDNVVAESKQFTDALGRPTQAQARNAASRQVFAAQTIYNTGGQPVLQTLAAPIDNQSFSYKAGFVTAGSTPYGPTHFEGSSGYAPTAVDASSPGTLGYYFSKQNTQEPLTPVTSYPYSLVEPAEGPLGGTKRAAGPGDELRLGTGRETKGRDFPVRGEFDNYLRLRPYFVAGSPNVTLENQALKSVSIDADGRERLVVTNKEGQAIISCLSGPQYLPLAVYGFLSAEADNPYGAPAYQDVHIPATGPHDVKFTVGGSVRILNLLTNASYDYPVTAATTTVTPAAGSYAYTVSATETHVTLPPGFYRFVSLSGTQWSYYEAHYGNFSYTYYDDAGRVVATVAPNGLAGGNLLRNPGFEQEATGTGAPSAWLHASNPQTAFYSQGATGDLSPHGGQLAGVHWTNQPGGHNSFSYQVVTGLPTGLYTARAWVKNTSIPNAYPRQIAQLLVEGYDVSNARLAVDIPVTRSWGDWVQVQVANIPVANGQCKVGLWSISPQDEWIAFDDVELVRQLDDTRPTFVTRNTYDTSGRLLATESNDEGRSEYVYARDGRIRFSQSALQRGTGRFSYSNYDEAGRVVESGEYTSIPWLAAQATVCGLQPEGGQLVLDAPSGQTFTGIQAATYGVASGAGCETATFSCSADVTARVQALLAAQLSGGNARTLRLDVTNANLGDPCSGSYKTLRLVATCTGPAQPPASPPVAPLAPASQRVVCGLQREGANDLVLRAPAGTRFTGIQAATYGAGNGADCTSFVFQPDCSADITAAMQTAFANGQLSPSPIELRIPANNTYLGGDPCPGVSKRLRITAVYEPVPGGATGVTVFENHLTNTPSATSTLQAALLEDRTPTGGLDGSRCAQRNQVWYDLPFDGSAGSQGNDSQLGGRKQDFVLGAVAKTKNDNVTTWYSYDELGRVTWVVQDFAGLGATKTLDYTYDFSGNVLEVAYQKGQPDSFYHSYTYDAAQRLTAVTTSPDGTARTLQAQYSYYLHGPLKRVQVAGDLQGVDYTYTLQGALKNINHINPTLEPGHDGPQTTGTYKDLFALTLDYFRGDYASRDLDAALPSGTGVPTRFDGTIQGAAWRTPANTSVQRMAYTYDEKSQLQNSTYGTLSSASAFAQFAPSASQALQEGGLTYDPNGNLLSLRRTGQTGAVTDNFSYVYKPQTNQLKEVHTGSASGTTVLDYDYDELGQLTRQRDEQGQRYLTYDVTGKTTGLYLDAAHTQPVVTFTYDDRGFRASKTAYPVGAATTTRTTYYVRDVAGNVLATYQGAAGSTPQRTEVPLYGASRLGTLTHLEDGTSAGTDDYRYELSDHLGDARVVFHRPTTTTYTATMEPGAASQEERDFTNVAITRATNWGRNGSAASARLGIYNGLQVGPSKILAVQKGDTVTFSAYAWLTDYLAVQQPPTSARAGHAAPLLGLLPLAAPAEAGPAAEPGQRVGLLSRLARLGLALALPLRSRQAQPAAATSGQPTVNGNAQLHYLVRDEHGTLVQEDYQSARPGTPGWWQPLQVGLRVQQGGTVELRVETNGNSSPDVYFDDINIEQTGGLIVQEQHQYAYGAPLPGLSYTVGNKRYRYGYQGQFAEHDDETGFESFELRLYNSRIGRWLSYDPEGQFSSPYIGMGNNPVSGVDPDGGWSGPKPKFRPSGYGLHAAKGLSTGQRLGMQVLSSGLKTATFAGKYTVGFYRGAGAGVVNTGKFFAGLTPWGANDSWGQLNDAGVAFLAPPSEKLEMIVGGVHATANYLAGLPNMDIEEFGYDVGYVSEKFVESIALDNPRFIPDLVSFRLNGGYGLSFNLGSVAKGRKVNLMYGGKGGAKTPFSYASKRNILRIEKGIIQDNSLEQWHFHYAKKTAEMSGKQFQKMGHIHRDLRPNNFGNPIGHNQ